VPPAGLPLGTLTLPEPVLLETEIVVVTPTPETVHLVGGERLMGQDAIDLLSHISLSLFLLISALLTSFVSQKTTIYSLNYDKNNKKNIKTSRILDKSKICFL
jgi:hypothetical protein